MKCKRLLAKKICPVYVMFATLMMVCTTALASNGFERIPASDSSVQSQQTVSAQAKMKTGQSIPLRLGHTHFDPLQKLPAQATGIKSLQAFTSGDTGYYIVQFDGPIQKEWKSALLAVGADIFDYLPDFAFIIRLKADKEADVRALAHVRWLGIYQPAYRISQSALDSSLGASSGKETGAGDSVTLRVNVFPGEDLSRVKASIASAGGTILKSTSGKWKTTLTVQVARQDVAGLPEISGVKWIEPVPQWKLFNNKSAQVVQAKTAWDTYGLYGQGVTVGVCDSGLDQGLSAPASLHDDFEDGAGGSRVLSIIDLVGDGASDVTSGHGTHVAGSVLGNGSQSGSDPTANSFPTTSYAGMAPKANLIFQASENNTTGDLDGIPEDLNDLFGEADTAGAHLHTNSWGSSLSGMYTSSSQAVDEYVWDQPDFAILFAAGNDGVDKDGDGVIDQYSVGSPATAKNCITVGASENNRPGETGGYDGTWGGSWPNDYSAEPVYSDSLSDNPDGMAAFSSRGPCLDGRFKPDIVGPGTNIISTKSSAYSGSGWGALDANYMYMGGTSMATPLVAGTVALLREYLAKQGHTSPSAALIKCALLNSAEDIAPGQYGTGSGQEIPTSPVPNNVAGWGRTNLANAFYPRYPDRIRYWDAQTALATGDYAEHKVQVMNSDSPLKINLVWTDYPGSPAAHGGLVNDLDLQVTGPDATVHYPDNALQAPIADLIAYDDDDYEYTYGANKQALRFTPASYPAHVSAITFFFLNTLDTTNDVDVVVYADDAGGVPGGTELFRKTLTYVPTGWITVGISGVTITSGDFWVAIEKNDTTQKLVQDDTGYGRSYYHNGSEWVLDEGYTTYIRATARGNDYATSFDRVNNAVGLTLETPAKGTYTIRVSGYNVPHGPQPYALVASGAIGGGVPTGMYPLLLLDE